LYKAETEPKPWAAEFLLKKHIGAKTRKIREGIVSKRIHRRQEQHDEVGRQETRSQPSTPLKVEGAAVDNGSSCGVKKGNGAANTKKFGQKR